MGSSTTSVAMDRLNGSPRHQEWVNVKSGDRNIKVWVVYPQVTDKVPVAILIHENRGLNDWARGMADQVAEAGTIAVAPDLLSDFDDQHKQTSDFENEDAARTALGTLDPAQVMADLSAVADWAKTIPASNGKLVTMGFCWGGARSFEFATKRTDLAASMVFYGTGPTDPAAYKAINAPVFGFYGGADERVNATIEASKAGMAGKTYDIVIYDGAGHAFMRSGEDTAGGPENVTARTDAWVRIKQILGRL
jgi:carboxymethylenebutenolidase